MKILEYSVLFIRLGAGDRLVIRTV